jgi:hypothetical protein
LSSLLDKSLIHWSGDEPTARYDILKAVRDYGIDEAIPSRSLNEAGEGCDTAWETAFSRGRSLSLAPAINNEALDQRGTGIA